MDMENNKTPLFKRIVALIGVVLLVGMYLVLLVQAVLGAPGTGATFIACAAATVAVPIAIWLILWVYSSVTGKRTVASSDPYGRFDNSASSTRRSIKNVIFDIGGVLVDFCWDDFLRNQGFSEEMVQRIGDASVRSEAWNEFDRGVLDTKAIIDGFVKNDPEIEAEIRKGFSDLTGLLRKRERTIPWIKALKKAGYKVLVLSNFSKQALEPNKFMNEFLDETDGGILSYKDKVIKPDRAIYQLITDRYNLVPSECVFIDDIEKNIQAARDFGMSGIVFKSYDQVDEELRRMGVNYEI